MTTFPRWAVAAPLTTQNNAGRSQNPTAAMRPAARIRPECPIRLGGVFTMGLGDAGAPYEESARMGVKLSAANTRWIAAHCDVAALHASTVTPGTFPAMRQMQSLFTPLLYVYASSLYEQENHSGNVGGWKPEMSAWTLRNAQGKEVPHPDATGHWMDYGNPQWAAHWENQVLTLLRRYGAFGVVAAELPVGNTSVRESLARYRTYGDLAAATGEWLRAVHREGTYLLVPSALNFDMLAGHSTLAPPPGFEQPELAGRLWDQYLPLMDGAWDEGWVHPYWSKRPLPEILWEIDMEAADRAAVNDQVFIAAAAYHNTAELEYALASYLLVSHRQGRFVFQPMPLTDPAHPDAGFSLAVLKKEVNARAAYFNVPLGYSAQVRSVWNVDGGTVWRRAFERGVVYVNSNDRQTVTVTLGGKMKRLNGARVSKVVLPPHSGAILLYLSEREQPHIKFPFPNLPRKPLRPAKKQTTASTPVRPLPYRWLYLSTNLLPAQNLPEVESLMRRAAKVGYTGIVLTDFKFSLLDRMDASYFQHIERIKTLAKQLKLELIPCVCPIGYSDGLFVHDPNLIEAMPVKNAHFVVQNGKADLAPDPTAVIKNGDFEEAQGDKAGGWDLQDYPGTGSFIDRETKHSGAASIRFENIGQADPQNGHGRIAQKITLKPFRCYRLSFWAKTRDFDTPGNVNVVILPPGFNERSLVYLNLGVKRNEDWTLHQVVFNSQNNTEAMAYLGVWDGKGGALWLDDVKLEEIGLVNLVRREGCPFTVKGEDGTTYEEGRDFEPVRDPQLGHGGSEFDLYHTPPSIVLTPNSRIKDGQILLVSFYHPAFIYDMQAPCCLTHPKVYALLQDQLQRVEKLFHPTALFMQHDEIRVANWCALCQAQHKTPGQLLADNVRRCIAMIKKTSPQARIYVWSDMFDPYHNAHDNYYLVNGTWAGSWEGLTPDVGIVDWYFEVRKKDLPWFAKRGHKQVLAGYYDNNADYTVTWLKDSKGVNGVDGVMYTTWQHKYDDLEKFAQTVWGGHRQTAGTLGSVREGKGNKKQKAGRSG
jgi:hypothetical protein